MKNDERDALPKRSASELSRDLRARAEMLTGEKFERTATIAMMREAADMIEQLALPAHQERTEPKGQNNDDVSVQPRLDRSEGTDDRASALFAGNREPAAANEAWHDVRVPELRREAVAEHERVDADTAKKLHTLVAEIRRCIGDDRLMAAHRKLDAIDELLRAAPARAAEWQPVVDKP